jgi:hypothetical protein
MSDTFDLGQRLRSAAGSPPDTEVALTDVMGRIKRRRRRSGLAVGVVVAVTLIGVTWLASQSSGDESSVFVGEPESTLARSPVSTAVKCVDALRVVEVTIENREAEPLIVDGAQFAGPYGDGPRPDGVPATPDPAVFGKIVVFGSPAEPGESVRVVGAIDGQVVGRVVVSGGPATNVEGRATELSDQSGRMTGEITEVPIGEACVPYVGKVIEYPDGTMTDSTSRPEYELTTDQLAALIGYTRARMQAEMGDPCAGGDETTALTQDEFAKIAFRLVAGPEVEGGPCIVVGFHPTVQIRNHPFHLFDASGNCKKESTWHLDEEQLRMLDERDARFEELGFSCPG